jgi:hypothetical protein
MARSISVMAERSRHRDVRLTDRRSAARARRAAWIFNTTLWTVTALVIAWLGFRAATATSNYSYYIQFASFPGNDDSILEWLRSQPGVARPSVTRDAKSLRITFSVPMMSRHAAPNVLDAADRLGYRGRGPFSAGYQNDWHLP